MTDAEIQPDDPNRALSQIEEIDGVEVETIKLNISDDALRTLAVRQLSEIAQGGVTALRDDLPPEPTEAKPHGEEIAQEQAESESEESDEDVEWPEGSGDEERVTRDVIPASEMESRPGGQPGVSKTFEERASWGKRKTQAIKFYLEHEGEYVTGEDFAEVVEDFDADDAEDRSNASRALQNAIQLGWFTEDPVTKKSKGRGGTWHNEYKLPEGSVPVDWQEDEDDHLDEEENDQEIPTHEVSGTVKEGGTQHEVLALLAHLHDREGEPQPVSDLMEVNNETRNAVRSALHKLKDKNLVESEEADEGQHESLWEPRAAGYAELDRIGGFQLNDG